MSSLLCLAHFCDTHGPTPLMVTEGLPVGCNSCPQSDNIFVQPSKIGSSTLNTTIGPSALTLSACQNKDKEQGKKVASAFTPPQSPKVTLPHASGVKSNDPGLRWSNNESERKRVSPCDNCALTLPKKTLQEAALASLQNKSPILRTRKLYERVPIQIVDDQSPSKMKATKQMTTSSNKDTCRETNNVSTSAKSYNFNPSVRSHDHYLDYTSTHEPLLPSTFSNVRQSCLRTLSCETLPPSTQSKISHSDPYSSAYSNSNFSLTASAGGPIFFGDPLAGYTIAYTFRIPDANVRGRSRVYALMALTSKREHAAMQAFSYLSTAFRELAQWILTLAELELERNEALKCPTKSGQPLSSFLNDCRKGLHEGGKLILKNRSLAEVVGMPDFFIELHSRFVRLLAEISFLTRF